MAVLSIIVPVYNVEKYVEKCLDSLVNQTLKDIEIVIVNDGSKDSSINICERYAARDARIKIFTKENGGLMAAWMDGVKIASSEYIGFVDSDDWVDNDFFELLYNKVKESQADIVVGSYVQDSEKHVIPYYRSQAAVYEGREDIQRLVELYLLNIFNEDHPISYCRWDKIYRKEILLRNYDLLDPRISLGEDVNTNIAVLPDCNKVVVCVENSYYHYRQNEASIVNTYKSGQINNILLLRDTLIYIADKKQVDKKLIDIFIGNMIFEELNKALILSDNSVRRKERIHILLQQDASKGCLKSYCAKRGIFHKIFYRLIKLHMYSLCAIIRKSY